jgi:hypothetical protein
MGCQKGVPLNQKYTICHTDPKTGIKETLELEARHLKSHYEHGDVEGECPHVNSLSYLFGNLQINAETFQVERNATNKKLINIVASQVLNGATPTPVTLRLNIDGYNGIAGTFHFGSPVDWGGTSTTTASFHTPAWFYPPSREGKLEIKEVKKRGDGEVITGIFSIILGGEGFNDWPLTDGHFSLLVPKI